jgi:hypothetical protein
MSESPDSIAASQARFNKSTRNRREEFTEHRRQVMGLIQSLAVHSTDRICILGAGNGNDLDLGELTQAFAHVHLVDLDPVALQHANESFNVQDGGGSVTIQATDVTGWLDQLEIVRATDASDASDADVTATMAAVDSMTVTIDHGPYDIVVSTCLLTQIFDSLVMAFGQQERLNELIFAARKQHLKLLINTLSPGGRGMLITDFTDSISLPILTEIPTDQFADAMLQAIIANHFFTGANPLAIAKAMQEQPEFEMTVSHNVTQPWRWDIGAKQLAVSAVQFLKR